MKAKVDPCAQKLANTPVEDDLVREEEKRDILAVWLWLETHDPIPHEEILSEFGLSMEDWERMGQTPLESGL